MQLNELIILLYFTTKPIKIETYETYFFKQHMKHIKTHKKKAMKIHIFNKNTINIYKKDKNK
jgi:hypothetical protein